MGDQLGMIKRRYGLELRAILSRTTMYHGKYGTGSWGQPLGDTWEMTFSRLDLLGGGLVASIGTGISTCNSTPLSPQMDWDGRGREEGDISRFRTCELIRTLFQIRSPASPLTGLLECPNTASTNYSGIANLRYSLSGIYVYLVRNCAIRLVVDGGLM